MKKLKSSYFPFLFVLLSMYLGVSISYKLTENSTSKPRSNRLDIKREYDIQLYKINDKSAFVVNKSNTISIVKYKESIFPFCFLCGSYEIDGTIVNVVEYIKNDWVYTKYPQPFNEGFHLKTGESFDIPENNKATIQDLESLKEYKSNLLSFSTNETLDINYIINNFEKLSTLNESCLIFNIAFIILMIGYILFGFIQISL